MGSPVLAADENMKEAVQKHRTGRSRP